MFTGANVVFCIDKKRVFPDLGLFGNVHFERGITALVRADFFTVYKYSRFIVDCAEMQEQYAGKHIFGKGDLAAIADSWNEIGMSDAG